MFSIFLFDNFSGVPISEMQKDIASSFVSVCCGHLRVMKTERFTIDPTWEDMLLQDW